MELAQTKRGRKTPLNLINDQQKPGGRRAPSGVFIKGLADAITKSGLKVDSSHISKIMRGERKPSVGMARAMAEVMDIEVGALLDDLDARQKEWASGEPERIRQRRAKLRREQAEQKKLRA